MSCTVENLEKNEAKLTIEVAAEEFEKALKTAYNKNKNQISAPGFRKGKVPQAMAEKLYGAGIFYEDAANELIPEEYDKAAKESGLDIVAQPEIDVVQIEKGKPFIFTAVVTLKPEVTLGEYKGVKIAAIDRTVTEEEINAELDKTRDLNSRVVTVEDRPVQDGDTAVIDFEGFVDDKPFEGGKGTNYELVIGSHTFIDNFEDQLIGKNVGEKVDVNVTFPADYQAEELAGKPALFKVTINKITVKELPELDDELVQEVSEFNTVDEYKADVKTMLEAKKSADARREREVKAVERAVINATMDIPEKMIDFEAKRIARDMDRNLRQQGLSLDMYIKYTGQTMDALTTQFNTEAETRVKNSLVLEAVVKAENITASDEDFEEEIRNMAETYGMEADKIKEYMGEEEKSEVMKDIAIRKAAEFVGENAVEE